MSVHLSGVPDDEVIGVIPAGQLAELGIVVDVPIIQPVWFDDRQTCALALRYLAGELEGRPDEFQGCPGFRAGRCAMIGQAQACIFLEAETAGIWRRARSWRLIEEPDGQTCVASAKYAAEAAAELGGRVVGDPPAPRVIGRPACAECFDTGWVLGEGVIFSPCFACGREGVAL